MAAVHFTTIPCELYTAQKYKERHFFNICPSADNIMYVRSEGLRTFLHFFFYERCFRALKHVGECTSSHLLQHCIVTLLCTLVVLLSLFIVQVNTCDGAFRTIFL